MASTRKRQPKKNKTARRKAPAESATTLPEGTIKKAANGCR